MKTTKNTLSTNWTQYWHMSCFWDVDPGVNAETVFLLCKAYGGISLSFCKTFRKKLGKSILNRVFLFIVIRICFKIHNNMVYSFSFETSFLNIEMVTGYFTQYGIFSIKKTQKMMVWQLLTIRLRVRLVHLSNLVF